MNLRDKAVLIVGAGPTGLVLALWLTKIGVRVRLVDKAEAAGTTSRALVVHARTLEFYRQLGIADEVVAKGFRFPTINLWLQQERIASVSLGDFGQGATPFPYVLIFPQDEHERLLESHLKNLGVEVERKTELVDFHSGADGILAKLKLPSGEFEECAATYLAGCDGARSRVREVLGTGFEGSTYPDVFYVADVAGSGPVFNGELHVGLDEAEFIAVFPLKDAGHARLIGVIREEQGARPTEWKDVNPRIMKELKIDVHEVRWFSTYHVHHRVASKFKEGPVFLLGDAAHIHSPVGGQGMNTGIGDAVNLAWKLGEVLHERAGADLLDSFEPERIGFARELVHTTDQAFRFISARGRLARFVRTKIVPTFLPKIFRVHFAGKFLFKMVSQMGITYRHSGRGEDCAGDLCAGDRLPWVESVNNFAPLSSLTYQVHVYGSTGAGTLNDKYPVHVFPWHEEMAEKGFKPNGAYLIRPDGYIAKIL
jgi:2-polyprenyl-6-methoxyphenol hydroxylase-like FAD-dependent oxidoreductase